MPVKVSWDILHIPQYCTEHTTKGGAERDRPFDRSGRITTFAHVADFFDHLNGFPKNNSPCFKLVVTKVEMIEEETNAAQG